MCIRDRPITAVPTQEPEQLPIVPPPADEPDLPEVDGSDLKARFEAAAQEAEPVSYTHLDVYKRQTLDFPTENRVPTGMLLAPIGNPEPK